MNSQIKPGCFAAATVYAMDSAVCQQCAAFKDCGDAAMRTLERIKSVVKVDDLVKRHRAARDRALKELNAKDAKARADAPPGPIDTPTPVKPVARATPVERVEFDVSEKHSRIILKMPAKAQEFATTLCKRGLVQIMRRNLTNGKTTPGIPKWLVIALQMLAEGGFTKATLKERLMKELSWSDGTAASHISLAVAILAGFEIASDTSGTFTVSPTVAA